MFRLLSILLLTAIADATSVLPLLHECPVCGEKSVTIALASYSNFNEPARDLSDQPGFAFANVDVCPIDLFASWSDSWKEMQPDEKAKLSDFLKTPALHLTAEEKAIIAGHEEDFRESYWFRPLWARTCDEFRALSDRQRFSRHLLTHYAGSYFWTVASAKDFEKRLAALYRENAISALKDAIAADWPGPSEKRVFSYLHAEFTRQAGRDEEAFALFQKVIAAERVEKPDEQTSWILQWATEQSVRAGPESRDPALLVAAIIAEMPDPRRQKNATTDPRWPRHYVAVEVLVGHATSGNNEFSDALWKLLDRNPKRLVALLETTDSRISSLRDVDPRWRGWFDEIAALLAKEQVPPAFSEDPDTTRVTSLLHRVVGREDDSNAWRNDVFLPAVRKAAATGGIPEVSIPPDPTDVIPSDSTEPTLNKVSRELYDLWKEQPVPVRSDIARVYTRILKRLDDDSKSFEYPVMYLLPQMAETGEGRAAIRKEFEGPWKSSFWKATCAYAAGMENSTDAFVRHPVTSKSDDSLIGKLLLQKSDPSWKDTAIRKLNENEYLATEVIDYLVHLDLPETRKALDDFARKVRNGTIVGENGVLYKLEEIESGRVREGLRKLPIR